MTPADASSRRLGLTLLLVVAGLAGRSALDKVLALQGGVERVALWAQVASVVEIVVGVVAAGVGSGLVVYVARVKRPAAGREHLGEALALGLRVALPVALLAGALGALQSSYLSGGRLSPWIFVLAALAGWVCVVPMLLSSYWLGLQRQDAMLGLAIAQIFLMVAAAGTLPGDAALGGILVAQALPALALLGVPSRARTARRPHPLRRYVLPGLSIGILSPLSLLVARGIVGDTLSWHDSGVLQAVFRLADWICMSAASFLSFVLLPRLAAARTNEAAAYEMRVAVKTVLLPSAVALAGIFAAQRPLLEVLYDPTVRASALAVGLLIAGSVVRIAAWIPLFALYARQRTLDIAIGELLSLPLFAVLMYAAGNRLTLEWAGSCWLFAYCAYFAYNVWAWRRVKPRLPGAP